MSGAGNKRRHLPEMDGGSDTGAKKGQVKITKRDLLKRYSKETEAVKKSNSEAVIYIPSYRAVLAQQGILVRNELGSGSYSKVKRAYCVSDYANVVAVKIVDKRIAAKDFLQRFLPREIQLWPEIKHSNIVQVHKLFQDDYRVYMVLEYAPGGDLLQYIQERGSNPIDPKLVRKWANQLCEAVSYLHNKDMAHRDLKLENLLLDASNNIKLTDFGFVKGNTSQNLSKTFCGSRSYASPEILKGVAYRPKKADVWATTSIIYIMATGRMPFDETKTTQALLRDQQTLNIWGFNKLNDQFASLIRFGFNFEYPLRPSIGQLHGHPWLNSAEVCLRPKLKSFDRCLRTSMSESTGKSAYSSF